MAIVRAPATDLGLPITGRPLPSRVTGAVGATVSVRRSGSTEPIRKPATSDQRKPITAPSQTMASYLPTLLPVPGPASNRRERSMMLSFGPVRCRRREELAAVSLAEDLCCAVFGGVEGHC